MIRLRPGVMLGRLAAAGRVIVWAQFTLAVVAIVYLGFHLFPVVFGRSPRPLAGRINARCRGADAQTSCNVSISELTPGRYRVSTDVPASNVTFVTSQTAMGTANILLVKFSEPMDAATINGSTVSLTNSATLTLIAATVSFNAAANTATLTPTAPLTRRWPRPR